MLFRSRLLARASFIAGLTAGPTCLAQAPNEPPTVGDSCIKIAPGKATEYEAFLHDVTVPLGMSRALLRIGEQRRRLKTV